MSTDTFVKSLFGLCFTGYILCALFGAPAIATGAFGLTSGFLLAKIVQCDRHMGAVERLAVRGAGGNGEVGVETGPEGDDHGCHPSRPSEPASPAAQLPGH